MVKGLRSRKTIRQIDVKLLACFEVLFLAAVCIFQRVLDHLVAELPDPPLKGCEVLLALVFVVDQEDALQDGRRELG